MPELHRRVMFIFPGQGSQYRGMGLDLYESFPVAKETYDCASKVLGFDIAEISFVDPRTELDLTRYTQPALLTHSIACMRVFEDLTAGRVKAHITAGHSLGEYSALVAAESLTFEQALVVVQKRGELMGRHGRGKMVAFNLDLKTIHRQGGHYCQVGGCNLPDQTIVGGLEHDLEDLVAAVKKRYPRARAVALKTEGAFHTYLMVQAAEEFRLMLDGVDFSAPRIGTDVLSNYTGDFHESDSRAIRAALFFQMFNPVKWIWSMQRVLGAHPLYRSHTPPPDDLMSIESRHDRSKEGPSLLVDTIIEFGGGLGGSEVVVKRPNLESITKKILRSWDHPGTYLPAINVETVTRAAHFFNALDRVLDGPRDQVSVRVNGERPGPPVDDNWFHLHVVVSLQGLIEPASARSLISRIQELGLADVVQVIGESPNEHAKLFEGESGSGDLLEPCLEVLVGSETAAISQVFGEKAIFGELEKLSKRLQDSGYSTLSPTLPRADSTSEG